jgi:hypothetical protein
MRRRLLVLALPACLLATGVRAETRLALSDAVLHGVLPLSSLRAELDPATEKSCLERYLASVPPRSPLWRAPPPASAESAQPALKRNLLEQMVALLGESVRKEASGFAHEFPLVVEWEGMMENPLGEADFIADWLAAHAGSPLAPFLQLLLAHRLDAAWRYAPNDKKATLASRFDAALAPALASAHATIHCLARDLRSQHARAQ